MYAFLASLIFIAAGEVAPPPPSIPDAEAVRYLRSNELAEWNSAMRATSAGETRVKIANSIRVARGIPAVESVAGDREGLVSLSDARPVVSKLGRMGGGGAGFGGGATEKPNSGGLDETPESVKARTQKMIDEGNAQIQQALPSLVRLRAIAAARAADKIKPVTFAADFAPTAWNVAVSQSVVRLQKQARDLGYAKVHFIGSISLLGDGKLNRPAELTTDIRSAWTKADDKSLAPVPGEGYAYVPGIDKGAPSLSRGLKPATAPKQVAAVWAEYYAVAAEGGRGLLFLRLADAHSMRLIASEVAFTELGVAAAPADICQVALRDDRSFLPRLSEGGDWVLGFDRASNPLGSALIAHLSVTQSKVGVAAAPYIVIVAGGGPAGSDGVRAKWRAITDTAPAGAIAFLVSSIPIGGEAQGEKIIDVGQLTLTIALPAAAK